MKNEVAFQLSNNSELYKHYMNANEEKEKFRELVKSFSDKHFDTDSLTYQMTRTLCCDKDTPGQTCKTKVNGLYKYKQKSATQKDWEDEVVSKIDFDKLRSIDFWYSGLINRRSRGRYALWQYEGAVYGYLFCECGEPSLPDGANEIRMSEYYKVIEKIREAMEEEK